MLVQRCFRPEAMTRARVIFTRARALLTVTIRALNR